MHKSPNFATVITILLATTLLTSAAQALIEFQVDCEQFTVGTKPQTARPTPGSVATLPLAISMDETAGTKVIVREIKALKGKAIVVDDRSGGKKGKTARVIFGSFKASDAAITGKVYLHFDWIALSHKAGNIGFVSLKNTKRKQILSLMFGHTKKDIAVIAGDNVTRLTDVVRLGKPFAVDIVLDMDLWRYELILNGKKINEGELTKTDDNSLLSLNFSTATSGIASFAIKNVIISPSPVLGQSEF